MNQKGNFMTDDTEQVKKIIPVLQMTITSLQNIDRKKTFEYNTEESSTFCLCKL